MSNSQFMNNAFVLGEVRDLDLGELGDRKNAKCRVNVYAGDMGFVNVQLNTSRNADENWAAKLYDTLNKQDVVQVSGSLEEFFYNDTYRRNISPYVSNKNGWGNSIKVLADDDKEFKANSRLAGDVIEREEFVDEDGTEGINFTILHYNLYNRDTGNEDLSRHQVLMNAINNFGDYAKKNDRNVDFAKLKNLKEDLDLVEEEDIPGIVNIYREFVDVFNPLLFTINEYHVTAYGKVAEEMREVNVNDNITMGVYIINKVVLDSFGFSSGSTNELKVIVFKGINESFGEAATEVDTQVDW